MVLVAPLTRLVITRLRRFLATGDQRDAEILALRHQLLVLQRRAGRPRFTDSDRTILATLAGAFDRHRLAEVFLIVQPATVIGWHRRLVAPTLDPTPNRSIRTTSHRRRAPQVDRPDCPGEPHLGIPAHPR